MENLSGISLDDVKVHRSSDKPTQIQAQAYIQGTDIHLAVGQKKHLPHEAWHVVQQKQGRVKPTKQVMDNVNVNDDAGLEKEADEMGIKAVDKIASQNKSDATPAKKDVLYASSLASSDIIQGHFLVGDIEWSEDDIENQS